jgi:hypothetical protein
MQSNAVLKTNNLLQFESRERERQPRPYEGDFVVTVTDGANFMERHSSFVAAATAVFHRIHSSLPGVDPRKEIAELLGWSWFIGAKMMEVLSLEEANKLLTKQDRSKMALLVTHISIKFADLVAYMEEDNEADFVRTAARWANNGSEVAFFNFILKNSVIPKFLPFM